MMQIFPLHSRRADVMELWEEALQEADEVIYIPMSSGLSGSCQTAMMLAEDFDGKVLW